MARGEREVRPLEPGRPLGRELAGGEVHYYLVTPTRGQYLRAAVEQRGVDVVVVLRGPDGVRLAEMDGSSGTPGTEELSWEATGSGSFMLEVSAAAEQANRGRYEVSVRTWGEATEQGRARAAAERWYMEGRRAESEGRGAAWERAIKSYGEAAGKWREAGERKWEVLTLNNLGTVYWELSRYERARDYFERALAIAREAQDRGGEGLTLNNLGGLHRSLSRYEQALDYLEQALAIMREVKNRRGEGEALNHLGNVNEEMSRYERARDYFKRALSIAREVNNRRGEGQTLNNLGVVHRSLNQYERARDYFEQSLPIRREVKYRRGEGITLYNLGIVYERLSQHERARDYFEQALPIAREAKDRRVEGLTLNDLGNVYRSLSQYGQARDYYEQALAIMREIKNRHGEALTLNNLGSVYQSLGRHERARDYFEQALPIMRDIKAKQGEGTTLNHLGNVYRSLGRDDKARDYYEQALLIMDTIGDGSGKALNLYQLASLAGDRGNLSAALRHVESALAITEDLRAHYTNQELRSAYFATAQDRYHLYVDLLMRLHRRRPSGGFAAAALEASERARARTLLELLAEARADIRRGVDPALRERRLSLQRQLNAKAERQVRTLGGSHTPEQAAAAEREIAELVAQYQDLEAQVRVRNPRYAALTQPAPLSLTEIQRLLDSETLLLEYALGERRSYLWAVTPTSLDSYELPPRDEIEAAARRVRELLTARNRHPARESAAERRARVGQADAEYGRASAVLSRMILGPVAARLGRKRLLVVGDGALHYVPLAALPEPAPPARTEAPTKGQSTDGAADSRRPQDSPPLVVNHEIVQLPSASTLAVLRSETKGRAPAAKAVAVLADPVFDPDDERVRALDAPPKAGERPTPATGRTQMSDLERAVADLGDADAGQPLARLPGTRWEAEQIMALVPAGQGLRAVNFAADRRTATGGELGRYRVVHFATHAIINTVHPELSGIVLSLVDERGQPRDGFLPAHEVFNLELAAELVVLSACRTGLGKDVKGEGLIGLTRGFMYAGAPRVVVSLWAVKDRATAELMARFYKRMLGPERKSAAAALREAQVEMWREGRWRPAYFWAGFVLEGEWR